MTFIYDLHPYYLEIYQMYKYELPMSRLSKVIVWQTNRYDRNYIPRRFAGGQLSTRLPSAYNNVANCRRVRNSNCNLSNTYTQFAADIYPRPRYATKTKFYIAATGRLFPLPVPVLITKSSPGTHNALIHTHAHTNLRKKTDNQLLAYCRWTTFNSSISDVRHLVFDRN